MSAPEPDREAATVESDMATLRARIEAVLSESTPGAPSPVRLGDAMRYSLLATAKRARAILTELTARHCGAEPESALIAACAVEMVHAASLVLDDLPAMDDATLRRGQPTCHRTFGEATAVLAAIALMNNAFRVVANDERLPPDRRVRVLAILARSIGTDGLTGGQEADLHGRGSVPAVVACADDVAWVHSRKTGALFAAATEIGAVIAGIEDSAVQSRLREFGMRLGLAFQAYDDLVDVSAAASQIGKDTGRDANKTTLVGLVGFDAALSDADAQMRAARSCVPGLDSGQGELGRYIDSLTRALRASLSSNIAGA